jgi:hypothetical protein
MGAERGGQGKLSLPSTPRPGSNRSGMAEGARADQAHLDFVKRFFDAGVADPTLYDLVWSAQRPSRSHLFFILEED